MEPVFALELTLTQSAYFRVHNRDDRIHGLYFVGAAADPDRIWCDRLRQKRRLA